MRASPGTPDRAPLVSSEAEAPGDARRAPSRWLTANSASALGACLVKLQRYDEAEPLLLKSYQTISAVRGQESNQALRTLNSIVHLYDTWGKPKAVGEWWSLLNEPQEAPSSE